MCNGIGNNCTWIIIILLLLFCCGNSCGGVNTANNCGCGCDNGCC
ncbi:MAG: hypothetical protein U0L72_03060 [Acutalibacteraceae bacterium]|nr:hypothetical protein [Acutalibacteraceae bacterium]